MQFSCRIFSCQCKYFNEIVYQISELAAELSGDQGNHKLHPIVIQYQDIMQSFARADNEMTALLSKLQDDHLRPVSETVFDDNVDATACGFPVGPPRIIHHLLDAEVIEGVK